MDETRTRFIKLRLLSLALRCDPIGSDDTDSGGVVGVSVFLADKVDGGRLGLRYQQKHLSVYSERVLLQR